MLLVSTQLGCMFRGQDEGAYFNVNLPYYKSCKLCRYIHQTPNTSTAYIWCLIAVESHRRGSTPWTLDSISIAHTSSWHDDSAMHTCRISHHESVQVYKSSAVIACKSLSACGCACTWHVWLHHGYHLYDIHPFLYTPAMLAHSSVVSSLLLWHTATLSGVARVLLLRGCLGAPLLLSCFPCSLHWGCCTAALLSSTAVSQAEHISTILLQLNWKLFSHETCFESHWCTVMFVYRLWMALVCSECWQVGMLCGCLRQLLHHSDDYHALLLCAVVQCQSKLLPCSLRLLQIQSSIVVLQVDGDGCLAWMCHALSTTVPSFYTCLPCHLAQ